MYRIRQRPVTLMELLIVMAIIALISGIVAIGINKALVDQRFRTEVSMIVDELRLAQDLMLILGTDVQVVFSEDENNHGINYWLELETVISKSLQQQIIQRRYRTKTVRGVFFEDKLEGQSPTKGQLHIKFMSKGAVMSKGIMRLSISGKNNPPKGSLENYISLAGYPCSIFSSDEKEVAEAAYNAFDDPDFDEALTHDTLANLQDEFYQSSEPIQPIESKDEKPAKNGK